MQLDPIFRYYLNYADDLCGEVRVKKHGPTNLDLWLKVIYMFCPDWVFDTVCAEVASLYLKNDVALALGAGKYTSFLSKEYEALSADEIAMASEDMIRLLGELEAGDAAVMLLEGFCYFRIMYSFQGVKRNLKPMFGSASSGTKEKEYSSQSALKRFKAYLFSYRSEKAVLAPTGWSLATQEEIKMLADIASQSSNPLDFL